MSNFLIIWLFCALMILVLIGMFRVFVQSLDVRTLNRARVYMEREKRKKCIIENAKRIKDEQRFE